MFNNVLNILRMKHLIWSEQRMMMKKKNERKTLERLIALNALYKFVIDFWNMHGFPVQEK